MARTVAGTLKLPDGDPLANADFYFVAKRNEATGILKGVTASFSTNASGVYSQGIEPGYYAVSASFTDDDGMAVRRADLGNAWVETDAAEITLNALLAANQSVADPTDAALLTLLADAQDARDEAIAVAESIEQATEGDALEGTDTTKNMPSLRVHQAFNQFGVGRDSPIILTNMDATDSLGVVYRYDSSITTSGTLPPGSSNGSVWISRTNSAAHQQFALDWSSNRLSYRYRNNSNYGEWVTLWHSGNFDPNDYILGSDKGAANGTATLGSDAKVPASQLPSYVDDVLEYADFSSLPVSGETGKIYITLDNSKQWRWSGSSYTELIASPGTTDAVTEGSSNLYHTAARVRAAVLTGLDTATSAVIAGSDSILSALGKIQARLNLLGSAANKNTGTAEGTVAAGDDTRIVGAAQKNANLSDLGSASASRANLGLKSAAVADIVGTASQSSGVPTGAIIERGSNANGEYVRYADGTQICTKAHIITTVQNSGFGAAYLSPSVAAHATAATFSSTPAYSFSVSRASGGAPLLFGVGTDSGGVDEFPIGWIVGFDANSTTQDYRIQCAAIGRWY